VALVFVLFDDMDASLKKQFISKRRKLKVVSGPKHLELTCLLKVSC
jgi:hypothetical protein